MRLIRYYGLYSSRSREKWKEWKHISRHAPSGWKEANLKLKEIESEPELDLTEEKSGAGFSKKNGSVWARLIAKIYEVDPLVCPHCGSDMKVIAVIMDFSEIEKILKHLTKTGKSPPGYCANSAAKVS